jgi:hypothetical protein
VAEAKGEHEPTLVERWLQEQQEWQRTLLAYFDAMVKKDDFLVNLGNAMRGSLLAGKAYPTAEPPSTTPNQADERLDRVLFALNTLQGQLQDLFMSIEEIRKAVAPAPPAPTPKPTTRSRPNHRRQISGRKRKARA